MLAVEALSPEAVYYQRAGVVTGRSVSSQIFTVRITRCLCTHKFSCLCLESFKCITFLLTVNAFIFRQRTIRTICATVK